MALENKSIETKIVLEHEQENLRRSDAKPNMRNLLTNFAKKIARIVIKAIVVKAVDLIIDSIIEGLS